MIKERLVWISNASINFLIKCLIIFVPLFFVYSKGEHYYFSIYDVYKEALVESIAALLFGFFLLKIYAEDAPQLKFSPLLWPILCLYAVVLSSTVQAYNLYEAFIFIRRWTAHVMIIFVVYNHVSEKKQLRSILNYLVFVGALVSLYGILQHLKIDFPFLHQNFTGNSTFGNPNFACEYMLLVFALSFLLVFADVHFGMFCYYIITTILMLIFLVLNKSRAIWIGGFFGGLSVIAYVVLMVFRGKVRFYFGKHEKKHALMVLKSLVFFLCLFILLVGLAHTNLHKKNSILFLINRNVKSIVSEVKTLTDIKLAKGDIERGDTATQRLLIWRNALRMVKSRSILGVGIGNFKIQYQPYRTQEEQLSTGPDIFVRRSHNEYVQLLAEIGIFGMAFFFWVIVATMRMCTAILKRTKEFYGQCVAIGLFLSLLSTYIAIFFNFTLQTPTPAVTLYLVTALLMSAYDIFLKNEETSRLCTAFFSKIKCTLRHGILIVILILLILPIWLVRPAQAYYCYQYGQALERMGLYTEAKVQLEKSLTYFYNSWETHFVLANVYSGLAEMLKAKEHHLIALRLNPYHQKGHYNLANTIYKIGETREAIKHYKESMRIDSIFHQAYNNLGSIYYKEESVPNHLEKSLSCFEKVIELEPTYASGQYNVGYILYLMGRDKEAFPYLQRALQQRPNEKKVNKVIKRVIERLPFE